MRSDVKILDLRTTDEFLNGHIPNAQNIDFYDPTFKSRIKKLPPGNIYVLYSQNDSRSHETYKFMKYLNFSEVLELEGGFENWLRASYKIQ